MVLAPSAFDSVPAVTDTDRRLVEAHRAGDPDAFSEIVHLHYRGLLAGARRRLGSVCDAEDAVQETLLRAFRGLDRFGASGDWRLGAWLTRILLNVCADAGTRRQAVDRLQERLDSAGAPPERDVADLTSDPVALDAVRRALDALPASQRRAFVLRVVEDLPYPTVAQELGITEDNARARVQRARATLRHILTDTRAVTGTLAAAPLVVLTSLRRSLHHLVGRSVAPHPGPAPHAPAASPGAATALSAVSGSAPTVSSLSTAAASGPMTASAQLVGQLAASPIGQAAMAMSGSAAGAGKGSLVIGLAASLATAGALTMPSRPSPSLSAGPAHPAPHALVVSPLAAPTPPPAAVATSSAAATTLPSSSSSSSGAGSTASDTGAGDTTNPTMPASHASATSPAWVQLAAAGTGTGTARASSGPATPAGAGTSGTTSAGSGSGGSGTTAGASGTTPGGAGTAASGPASSAAGTAVLPAGTCTGVAGFDGVSTTPAVPPLSSAAVVDTLDTGSVRLGGTASAPGLEGFSAVTGGPNDPGTRVAVTAGTCLGTGGSLLAVDLADVSGAEVQLVGSLVANPAVASSAAPGATSVSQTATTTTTYLFRGSVTQIAGVFTEHGPLPWGVSHSFVAELQVVQPTGTADLTIAFVEPTSSSTAATTGSPSATTSPTASTVATQGSGGSTSSSTGTSSTGTSSTGTSSTGTSSTGTSSTGTSTASTDPATSSPAPRT